jgi:His/Glu/Gln/Arg/opine family amino acid ABC transporter permease subunit
MLDYLPELLKGLHTSLTLTVASIIVALILSLIFTIILTLKTPGLVWIVRGYITLFTGTPLLVQIFLIYYGPGQFPSLQEYPALASDLRAVAVRPDRPVAQQRRLYHPAVLWRHPRDPRRAMAVLQRAGDE